MDDARLGRLLDRVAIGDGCWLWRGTMFGGYPRFSGRLAHRLMYEAFRGPIPDGHHVHHRCGTKQCVRPGHLEAISAGEHSRLHDAALRAQSRQTMQRHRARHLPCRTYR